MTTGRKQLPGFDADELWWSWFHLGPQGTTFQVNAEFCLAHRPSLEAALVAASLKLGRRYGVFLADLRSFAACAISRPPVAAGLVERRLFCIPVYAPTSAVARLAGDSDIGIELCALLRRHGLVTAPGSELSIWPWPSAPLSAAGAHPTAVRELALRLGDMVAEPAPAAVAAAALAFDAVDGGSDPTLARTIAGVPDMAQCLLFGVRVARFAADASRPADWLAVGRCTDMALDRWKLDAATLFGSGAVVHPPVPLDQALLHTACSGVHLALAWEACTPPQPCALPDEFHVFRDEAAGQVEVMHCRGDTARGPVRLPWGLVANGFADFLDLLSAEDGSVPILHKRRLHRSTISARRRGTTPWADPAD